MKFKKLAALVLAGVLCISALTGCGGMDVNETAATLGEQTVSLGIANFMCKYQKAEMDDSYTSFLGEDVWSQDLYGNGVTLEDDLKNSTMEFLHEMYTLKANMEEYNISITEEEQKKIKEAASAFLKANSEEAIEEFGATQELVEELLSLYTIQWKMYEAMTVDTDREVSDEEANMRGYSMVSIGIAGEYDENGAYKEYTDTKVAELRGIAKKMEAALAQKDLNTVAKEYKYEVKTGTYAKDDTTFEKEVLEAMNNLKEGQVSKMIETKSAIYFVRIDKECDKEATEAHREEIIADREYEVYKNVLTEMQKDDGWKVNENVVNKIEFHNLFTQTKESTESKSESIENTEGK
ncbi:MAG: peptidyl-prolyl cis-trans isomerase [Lachnospiraceae bacterium]|nr:peptidyl-prolyl cis-trans isomerase [Lachnospiraceae bacterium]